jgi:ferredoxin-type protein NapG
MAKIETDRRKFIKYSTLGALGVVLGGGVVFSPYLEAKENRLRPPGALPEKQFLSSCIKCGQCLQVCPYHSIKLSDMVKGTNIGTPYIDPNVRACYACTAVPCVLACPSGALDHGTEKAEDISMGIAVLEFPDTCLAIKNENVPEGYSDKMYAFTGSIRHPNELEIKLLKKFDGYEGKQCTLCADMCPIPNPLTAITMVREGSGKRPEIYDGCVGCGACQDVCPTKIPSIVIKPKITYEDIDANNIKGVTSDT